jgi:tRNA threonylcarbamoyladenosine biosynthesis protein TsaE
MSLSATCITHTVDATEQLGRQLGAGLRGGEVLCLSGDLGAGKTALARGIGVGWGAREAVSSPTFVFIHEHRRHTDLQRLYHVDCYRLEQDAEAASLGLEDLFDGDDVVLLEWPERVMAVLPPRRVWIEIDVLDENSRRYTFSAADPRDAAVIAPLRHSSFVEE